MCVKIQVFYVLNIELHFAIAKADIQIDNQIIDNNRDNSARPGSILATVPPGTGVLYLGVDESLSWLASEAGLAIAGIAFGSCVAYAMFFYTIKSSGPVFASQCAYAVTISGVIWGIIIFSEQHSIWIWISVIVMLLGLVLVSPDEEAEAGDDNKTAIAKTSC